MEPDPTVMPPAPRIAARVRLRAPRQWLRVAGAAVLCALLTGAAAPPFSTAEWPRTDFTNAKVPLEEIVSGGPPRDGIPSIDAPRFVPAKSAAAWLDPREPVIALSIGGDARAYPLQILLYHEIVNDTVGALPVAVTFCPLCNAAIVFDRRVGGRTLDFGTTGRLRKSDLVMYDRQTESWWQQFTGLGIVGEHAGVRLEQVPAQVTAFSDFRAAHPQGRVLSRETGHVRPYGRNPYRGYDRVGQNPFLFHDPVDPRLPAMERVLGLTVDGASRVYPFSLLERTPVINDRLGDVPIVVLSKAGMLSVLDEAAIAESRTIAAAAGYRAAARGRTLAFERRGNLIVDRETGSHWDLLGRAIRGPLAGAQLAPIEGGVHFAFAWLAFMPGSDIYAPPVDRTPARGR